MASNYKEESSRLTKKIPQTRHDRIKHKKQFYQKQIQELALLEIEKQYDKQDIEKAWLLGTD